MKPLLPHTEYITADESWEKDQGKKGWGLYLLLDQGAVFIGNLQPSLSLGWVAQSFLWTHA